MSSPPTNVTTGSGPKLDLTGRVLGDYTLVRRLGRGGMADVYLAHQGSLKRNVAFKVLKPELASDESYVHRFQREAQSAATLVQANIVQIYEVGQIDEFHFIAQEYVHGRNLRQFLDRHGAVEPLMAINVLRQVTAALQKAADFNIVHRDIKPENILISTTGEVKVTDFGLARANDNVNQQALTKIGVTMGTPLYMSPEQVAGKSLDARSDIYSLGVTAYHMLAGEPPFNGENALAIAVQQVQDSAEPLAEIRPDVPLDMIQIIETMMAKEPGDRPQNPAQLATDLRKISLDFEDGWESLLEKLATAESHFSPSPSTVNESRLAATQQLQSIMSDQRRYWWQSGRNQLRLAVISLASLVVGIAVAHQTVPPFPLAENLPTRGPQEIPRESSVEEQYEAAYWGTYAIGAANDPRKAEYWKAVIDYFPLEQATLENMNKTLLYHRRAKARLGEVYLSQMQLPEALAIYEKLENSEELSEQFRITGSAGKAIVYDLMSSDEFSGGQTEKEQKVRESLGKVGAKIDLLNEYMRDALAGIQQRYPPAPPPLPTNETQPDSIVLESDQPAPASE